MTANFKSYNYTIKRLWNTVFGSSQVVNKSKCGHGVCYKKFEGFWSLIESHERKSEKSSLLRLKNTQEIIINHHGIRKLKDGED